MSDFVRFWLHNSYIGREIGDGLFGAVENACIFTSAGLLAFKRITPKYWKNWEERAMRTAFYLFIGSFLIATSFVAPFLQYERGKGNGKKPTTKWRAVAESPSRLSLPNHSPASSIG
jgi:hypothetical protein